MNIIIVLAMCSNVFGNEFQSFFYIEYENEKEIWLEEKLNVEGFNKPYEKAYVILSNLFSKEDISFVPKGIKILDIYLLDDCLVVNVSKDINKYGGTYYEKRLIAQIVKNVLSIDGINKITLLIEGEEESLNEGTLIKKIDFYEELEY